MAWKARGTGTACRALRRVAGWRTRAMVQAGGARARAEAKEAAMAAARVEFTACRPLLPRAAEPVLALAG